MPLGRPPPLHLITLPSTHVFALRASRAPSAVLAAGEMLRRSSRLCGCLSLVLRLRCVCVCVHLVRACSYEVGVAVQFFGDVPPCDLSNPAVPFCLEHQGEIPACCTADCQVCARPSTAPQSARGGKTQRCRAGLATTCFPTGGRGRVCERAFVCRARCWVLVCPTTSC
jgi:hypothetical protein